MTGPTTSSRAFRDTPDAPDEKPTPDWFRRFLRGLFKVARFLFLAIALLWAALAIHYSTLPWPLVRTVLGVAFFAFGVWALWITHARARNGSSPPPMPSCSSGGAPSCHHTPGSGGRKSQ